MAAPEADQIGHCARSRCPNPLPSPPGHWCSKYCSDECEKLAAKETQNSRKCLSRLGLSRRDFLYELVTTAVTAGYAAEFFGPFCDPRIRNADDIYERGLETWREAKAAVGHGEQASAERLARRGLLVLRGDPSSDALRLRLSFHGILRDVAQEPLVIKHCRASFIEWSLYQQQEWPSLAFHQLHHSNLYRSQPKQNRRAAFSLANTAATILEERCDTDQPDIAILQAEAAHWQLRNVAMEGTRPNPFCDTAKTAYECLKWLGGDAARDGAVKSAQLYVESLREAVGMEMSLAKNSHSYKERNRRLGNAADMLAAAELAYKNLPDHQRPQAHALSFPRMGTELLFLQEDKETALDRVDEFLDIWQEWHESYALRGVRSLVEKYARKESSKIPWPPDSAPAIYMPGVPYLYLEQILAESKLLI